MNAPSVLDELEQGESVRAAVREPVAARSIARSTSPVRQRTLFADSLLETSSRQRGQRTWATLLSCILQCTLISVLILVPLWYTDELPTQQLVTLLVAPPPPPPPPPAAPAASAVPKVVKAGSDIVNGQLRVPGRIPSRVEIVSEGDTHSPAGVPGGVPGGVVGGVPGGIPGGQLGGVLGGILGSTSNLAALPKLSNPTSRASSG